MEVQWNHCLRTDCNKNFRAWIAGVNSFCQLVEIRSQGYPGILATGSYSPLTGINILTLIISSYFPKERLCTAETMTNMARPQGKPEPLSLRLASTASARHQLDPLKVIWLRRLPLACFGAQIKKKSGPESCLLPPAPSATQYHAKINFQALAWWNIWPTRVGWKILTLW